MSQRSEGITLIYLICLSLFIGDEVDFSRSGEQVKGNTIKKEIGYGACLH